MFADRVENLSATRARQNRLRRNLSRRWAARVPGRSLGPGVDDIGPRALAPLGPSHRDARVGHGLVRILEPVFGPKRSHSLNVVARSGERQQDGDLRGSEHAEEPSTESARESWRLLPLRGWSNAKEIPLPPRGA